MHRRLWERVSAKYQLLMGKLRDSLVDESLHAFEKLNALGFPMHVVI